jgi:hypothetical protein
MPFFTDNRTEAEKFVRAHCLFINTYFATSQKSVYCSDSIDMENDLIACGRGDTKEKAWEQAEDAVRQRLARLETLNGFIGEVDNSSIPSKEMIGAMLREEFEKLGKGVKT